MDSIQDKLEKVVWLTQHAEELDPEDPIIRFLGGFNFGDDNSKKED